MLLFLYDKCPKFKGFNFITFINKYNGRNMPTLYFDAKIDIATLEIYPRIKFLI